MTDKPRNNFTDDMFLPYSWEHYRGVSGSEIYARLHSENVIPREPVRRVDALAGFIEGYYAMVHTGTWWFGLLANQAPHLEGRWRVALLPEGTTTRTFGHCNPWIIPLNAQNPNGVNSEAAEAWFTFMFDVENAIQLSRYFGSLPPMIAAYDHPFLRDNPNVMVFFETLRRGVNSLRNVRNAEPVSEVIWNMLADVRDGVIAPREALQNANAEINRLIN